MDTVLLVEDNDNNANIIEDMFAFDDIPATLVTVVTGEDALYRRRGPAVANPDGLAVAGPRRAGYHALLKGNPLTKEIPCGH